MINNPQVGDFFSNAFSKAIYQIIGFTDTYIVSKIVSWDRMFGWLSKDQSVDSIQKIVLEYEKTFGLNPKGYWVFVYRDSTITKIDPNNSSWRV